MVLTRVKGIGKIKLSDVADIVTIDNEGESYAKLNGEDALLLSAFTVSYTHLDVYKRQVQL